MNLTTKLIKLENKMNEKISNSFFCMLFTASFSIFLFWFLTWILYACVS